MQKSTAGSGEEGSLFQVRKCGFEPFSSQEPRSLRALCFILSYLWICGPALLCPSLPRRPLSNRTTEAKPAEPIPALADWKRRGPQEDGTRLGGGPSGKPHLCLCPIHSPLSPSRTLLSSWLLKPKSAELPTPPSWPLQPSLPA